MNISKHAALELISYGTLTFALAGFILAWLVVVHGHILTATGVLAAAFLLVFVGSVGVIVGRWEL